MTTALEWTLVLSGHLALFPVGLNSGFYYHYLGEIIKSTAAWIPPKMNEIKDFDFIQVGPGHWYIFLKLCSYSSGQPWLRTSATLSNLGGCLRPFSLSSDFSHSLSILTLSWEHCFLLTWENNGRRKLSHLATTRPMPCILLSSRYAGWWIVSASVWDQRLHLYCTLFPYLRIWPQQFSLLSPLFFYWTIPFSPLLSLSSPQPIYGCCFPAPHIHKHILDLIYPSSYCLISLLLESSVLAPCSSSSLIILTPSSHCFAFITSQNYTCRVHQSPPYCHIQCPNLSLNFHLSAAFYIVDYPTSSQKISSLGFWNITLFGSPCLSLAFPSHFLLLAHLHLFILEYPRGQPLDLASSLSPHSLTVSCHPHAGIPQFTAPSQTFFLNTTLMYSLLYSTHFLGCLIDISMMPSPRLNCCFFLKQPHIVTASPWKGPNMTGGVEST